MNAEEMWGEEERCRVEVVKRRNPDLLVGNSNLMIGDLEIRSNH